VANGGMGNNKDNDSMAAPKAAGPFSFLKNPSTSGSSVSPTTPDAPTPVEAPQDDASWLVGCNRICLSQLISKQTKKCLEMLKYPFYRGLKPAEHDISDTMMPVYNFVELLTHLQDSPEVRLTSNFAFNHMKLRKWIKTTEVVAHPALTSFFAEWGIEVEPLSNAQSSQNVDKAVVLAEIAIISNAIEHCQRQWEKCFPQAGPQEVLWPEDFTVTEQQALRHFAKIKLKAMGKHLDTQEDRLNAIEEIRYVKPWNHSHMRFAVF
jgi:hypothetical protein